MPRSAIILLLSGATDFKPKLLASVYNSSKRQFVDSSRHIVVRHYLVDPDSGNLRFIMVHFCAIFFSDTFSCIRWSTSNFLAQTNT